MTKKLKIKFYQDPGHGWVAVKRQLLKDLGIEDDISIFSYTKGATVYLEENSDAHKLSKALEKAGIEFELVTVFHRERSPIRSYPSYYSEGWNCFKWG